MTYAAFRIPVRYQYLIFGGLLHLERFFEAFTVQKNCSGLFSLDMGSSFKNLV
jgi:hypothetical protein